ncbi:MULTISPECIES: hypothetical protein [Clostridium]|jgi:hypothetical protein|uniref:hypothetical protein n=1 Tax=Clostridium TaxID=1485 RepID=UPI000E9C274F|nr:hypothetical protein [Clostridium tyrobutyricum]HBF76919.1 hypothetical protein [Clostridiaceae bacterium]
MENNITIEIGEEKLNKIKIYTDSGIETKYISLDELMKMIESASTMEEEKEEFIESPIFPQFSGISTIQYRESQTSQVYIIKKEACRMDLTYFGDKFNNVGIPTLLFKILVYNNSIKGVELVAVKDAVITEHTPLFKYPFSNVFDNTSVCLGANNIAALDISETAFIYRIPNLVLSLENNNDAYNNANNTGLALRELLNKLSNNDFNNDWLKPLNMDYSKWANR